MRLLFVFILGFTFAQQIIPTTVPDDAAIATLIDKAQQDIFVASRTLQSAAVAEALRSATRRGVHVFILTTDAATQEPNSYLKHVAAANFVAWQDSLVHVADVDSDVLVIDNNLVVQGSLVAGQTSETATILLKEAREVQFVVSRFVDTYQSAPSWVAEWR
jgi:hypothetical protein